MKTRQERLMPRGIPRYIRCYDNGDRSCDRYTVVYGGRSYRYPGIPGRWHLVVGMSGAPFHPQGVCLHDEYDHMIDAPHGWPPAIGRKCHLGVRIPFTALPADCRRVVREDYRDLWGLAKPTRKPTR